MNKSAYFDKVYPERSRGTQYKQKGLAPIAIIAIVGIIIVGVFAVTKTPSNRQTQTADKADQKTQQTKQSSNLYSNFDEQISIEGPKGWKLIENPAPDRPDIVLQFDSPKESNDDKYNEHIGLAIDTFSSNINLDEFVDIWLEGVKKRFNGNVEVISREKTSLGGVDAYKVVQIGKEEGKDYKVKFTTILVLKGNKGYTLNYTSPGEGSDQYLQDVEKSFQSFKFGSQQIQWETYRNDQIGYIVEIPKDWKVTNNPSETSREISIVHPQGKALVLITALKDEGLKDINYLKNSVAAFKTKLENDPTITELGQFKDQYDKDTGVFITRGFEKREGKDWYFEQRGVLSTKGKVVLMHGAVLGNLNKEYLNIIADLMDSFKID